ncbi:MAG: FliM/FliN family flagellar motor switch protein, partial [Planctomycetes bacterium]|nr:FliM/FliN family flagellar motor switch protein [Planctomycetota bacterium]
MAEEEGLLSQADIDAALADAGVSDAGSGADEAGGGGPDATAGEAVLTQAPIDRSGEGQAGTAAAVAEIVAEAQAAAVAAEPATLAGGATLDGAATLPAGASPFEIAELPSQPAAGEFSEGIDLLRDVELNVEIELGRSRMLVDDVLRLAEGSVVELDKLAGDPVDVYVNDR